MFKIVELDYSVVVGNLICTWESAFLLAFAVLGTSYISDRTPSAKLKNSYRTNLLILKQIDMINHKD